MANHDKQSTDNHQNDKQASRQEEKQTVNHIVYWIVGTLVVLLVIIAFMSYRYVKTSLQPVDSNSHQTVEVNIPIGSSNKEIATRLQNKGIIRSATVFNYYVKTQNDSNFQAGYHKLSPAMTLDEVIAALQKGGTAKQKVAEAKVVVKEGVTVDEIGTAIQKATKKNKKFKKSDFIKLMKNQAFLDKLAAKYPTLLSSSMKSKNVRYHLEGYLFPATYPIYKNTTLKSLVTEMVATANTNLKPYYKQMAAKDMTVQQTLTLASIIEREGVKESDRQKIAGVFYNRFDANMPIQSDITVMYALKTHKTHLTNKDVQVDSPYNLYKNTGYGPGPFNSPSLYSVYATLHPKDQSKGYLYFIANLKTGKVHFFTTLTEQQKKTSELGQ
ncbi:hypothetical protein IV38_GL000603 [Lactobacillus selangorensis]|uniref:Endolytic murein transglycosylase n=1 Tax=Lactobacillus selangorensis TaxID=81857 RepID=A0A0R2FMA6_9LACO|nr:endolytic transglycosylase MltG [Lactobacillus selangorensis]KRN29715.1 hypothetical protein IV38_GL000603 [Lactobacillus selangorensis]KRN33756.1 hypothetical protein IV40_GL000065 [Lactobacillus selangorensis]